MGRLNNIDQLTELFQELPQVQRACVILHHRGYAATQIAEELNIQVYMVFSYVNDGHRRLLALARNDQRFRSLLGDNTVV